jgi:hypothetical protein
MPRLKLNPGALRVQSFQVVDGDPIAVPGGDTGCTEPCMSGDSMCYIVSCGSSCVETEGGTAVE